MGQGNLVAWNEVSTVNLAAADRARVGAEIALLNTLKHERIVDFYGTWATPDKVVFVTAIVESGDLQKFYKSHSVKLKVR